jgi:hypothetical protein
MRYCSVPPGEPEADAYNLLVASCQGSQLMADTISKRVKDWVPVAAYLAGYASIAFNKIDERQPEIMNMLADMLDVKHGVKASA